MARAFGIINFAGNHIQVEGMQAFRPVGSFPSWDVTVSSTFRFQI